MRPLRLRIKNFTCYRGEQEIDFQPLQLFAIAGPTGSGKSTILDAMTFALYGQIPRMGSRNLDEFISLGAKEASVVLDFRAQGGQRFRVVRTMRKGGAKKAQLEELLDGGGERSIADGVRPVDEALKPILGLGYQAFVQAVLLPQGKFADFLQGERKARREILRELLRLGVYEQMRQRAESEKNDLKGRLATLDERLGKDYAHATEEALKELQAEATAIADRLRAKEEEVRMKREAAQRLDALWGLYCDREKRKQERAALEERSQAIATDRERSSRAQRAEGLKPYLERVRDTAAALRQGERRAAQAREEAAKLEALLKQASDALGQAENQAGGVPELQDRREKLLAVLPYVYERKKAAERLQKSDGTLKEVTSRLLLHAQLERDHGETVRRLAGEQSALQAEQSELGYDAGLHERLLGVRELAGELRRSRQSLAASTEEIASAQEELESAEAALASAAEKLSVAETNAEKARLANVAATLVRHLHVGEDCPVCRQTVAVVPEIDASDDSEDWAQAARQARKEHGQAQSRQAVALRSVQERGEGLAALKTKCNELGSRLASFAVDGSPVEESVLACLQEVEDLARSHQQLDRRLNDLEIQRRSADAAVELAANNRASAEREKTRLEEDLAETRSRLSDCDAKIAQASSEDPAAEEVQLKERITLLLKNAENARRRHAEVERESNAAAQARAVAESTYESAKQNAQSAVGDGESKAKEAGFETLDAADQALLSPEALTKLDAQIRQHDQALHDIKSEITRLDAALEGTAINEQEVVSAKQALGEAVTEQTWLSKESGGKQAELKALEEAVRKAADLREQRDDAFRIHAVIDELARELRTDRFQQHLLDEAFQNLVLGASQRLRSLNDRYQLAFAEDSFVVLDQENGGEQRSADTLSGGETFLVSLALALELSEQVQQAAGAIRLDSLFIDEGFGTLDPETLETVATAIESLVAGDRMIGVISHVRELHQRLPARLEVIPASAGSTVRFVPTD